MDFLIKSGGSEQTRTYEVAKSNLILRSYYRSIARQACAYMRVKDDELTIDMLIDYLCSDEDTINQAMRKFYIGDHTGIDWANEDIVQPELVEVALLNFFVEYMKPMLEKMNEQLKSSQASALESPKQTKQPRKRSVPKNTKSRTT